MHIPHARPVLKTQPGELHIEPQLLPEVALAQIDHAMPPYLMQATRGPGSAYVLHEDEPSGIILRTIDSSILIPDIIEELSVDHQALHRVIALQAGMNVVGSLVKINYFKKEQPHPYHRDGGGTITTATALLGNAFLGRPFQKSVAIVPGDSFTIFNGKAAQQQPWHGIFHPSEGRASLVIRSFLA